MTDKISGRHGNGTVSRKILEKKIIQIPVPVPDADPWMKTFFDNKSRQLFLKIFNTKIFELNESRYN